MVSLKTLFSFGLASLAIAAPRDARDIGPTRPSDDPFYDVPSAAELAKFKVGDILRNRKPPKPISALGVKPLDLKSSYQFLYKTVDSLGNDTATVLTVAVPHNADYRKVLSYQVAEDAAYINCAPSYALQLGSNSKLFGSIITKAELALVDAALQQGWIVIMPDHEGHNGAWLARENAAHSILDGMRAALRGSKYTEIKPDAIFAMWGYSGGAITSGAAAEIKDKYAPELNIVGAALGGTAPDIPSVVKTCNNGQYSGIIAGGIMGLTQQYPWLKDLVYKHVKPEYKDKFTRATQQCLIPTAADFLFQDVVGMFDIGQELFDRPDVKALLAENNMGHGVPSIPLFVYKGVLDDLTPVKDTDKLVDYYCDNGAASVQYYRDATANHGAMAVSGAGRALGFLHSVMNGEKQPSGCKTTNVLSSWFDFKGTKYIPDYLINLLLDLVGKPVGPVIG